MRSPAAGSLPFVALVSVAACVALAAAASPDAGGPKAWSGCCGLTAWPPAGAMPRPGSVKGTSMSRGFRMFVPGNGSGLRHHLAQEGDFPKAYRDLHNRLPATPQNARRGAAIYEADCASCHGATGLGDGPQSHQLTPAPAELGWITRLPTSRWDPFMYWSIADGGTGFGSAMPAYKGKLSDEQIWSVIGYVQARLPKTAPARQQ